LADGGPLVTVAHVRLNTGSDIVVDDPDQLRLHALAPERVEEDVGEGLRVRRGRWASLGRDRSSLRRYLPATALDADHSSRPPADERSRHWGAPRAFVKDPRPADQTSFDRSASNTGSFGVDTALLVVGRVRLSERPGRYTVEVTQLGRSAAGR